MAATTHHLLRTLNRDGELGSYHELGGDFYDTRDRAGAARLLVRGLTRGSSRTVRGLRPTGSSMVASHGHGRCE